MTCSDVRTRSERTLAPATGAAPKCSAALRVSASEVAIGPGKSGIAGSHAGIGCTGTARNACRVSVERGQRTRRQVLSAFFRGRIESRAVAIPSSVALGAESAPSSAAGRNKGRVVECRTMSGWVRRIVPETARMFRRDRAERMLERRIEVLASAIWTGGNPDRHSQGNPRWNK